MNKEIISKIIGRLKQEESFSDWWKSEEVEIPFFDNDKLTITFMDFEPEHDKTFIDEADHALTNFLKLNVNDRNLISELAYKNCMEFLDAVEYDEADKPLRQIKNKNEIWNFIQPTEIYVTRRPYKLTLRKPITNCIKTSLSRNGQKNSFHSKMSLAYLEFQGFQFDESDNGGEEMIGLCVNYFCW